jgi:CTD kinase subunit beta
MITHPRRRLEICHSILDLLVAQAGSIPQSYRTSPTTPSSPSPYPSPRTPNPFKSVSSGTIAPYSEESHIFTASHLTRLKIALRKQEATLKSGGHAFRKRAASQSITEIIQGISPRQQPNAAPKSSADQGDSVNGAIGKNEGTVRFLFGPGQD